MPGVGVEFDAGRDAYTENSFSGMGDWGGVQGNTGLYFGSAGAGFDFDPETMIVLGVVAVLAFAAFMPKKKRGR